MPTIQDLLDACAFERTALSVVFPLIDPSASELHLDIRDSSDNVSTHAGFVDVYGSFGREEMGRQLRPLMFGAAWKVLDLVLEHAFVADGLVPKDGKHWKICEKQKHARAGRGEYKPLSDDSEMWKRITGIYAETVEARHSLVHRRCAITQEGDISGIVDLKGTSFQNVSAGEQEALCVAAQMVVRIGASGLWRTRERSRLWYVLDRLAAHHGLPIMGGSASQRPEIILVNASNNGGKWGVDLARVRAFRNRHLPHSEFIDLELHFPGTGLSPLRLRLEDAPDGGEIEIDPANPPEWAEL